MQTKASESERINTRISPDIKERAQIELAKKGLTISEYMRIVLTSVANEGLPQHFGQPSSELLDAIGEMLTVVNGDKKADNTASSLDELNRELDS